MRRRDVLKGLSSLPALSALPRPAIAQSSKDRTLRLIHSTNLVSLDPIWTTAPPTKDYAFLVFDQLIAVDAAYVPKPQMADGWTVEDDGKSYVISLRDGLFFHDGEPVRSSDCIPSIQRWGARDGFGQGLMRVVDKMEIIDDRRFRIRLKRPFPLLPAALGKSNSSQCFIMPERMAKTDPMKQVTESIGSGPYKFVREEWVNGSRAAFAKFERYVPRKEPVSSTAGGRIPALDRIEWSIIGDASTAMAALQAGEQDFWDQPPADLVPVLSSDPNLVVEVRNTSGSYTMLCYNHIQPPFNNVEIRRALAMGVNQDEFIRAVVGNNPELMQVCNSFFACGTPYGTDTGADVLKVQSVEKAQAALKAAGYKGEKVVLIGNTDSPTISAMSQVADDLLRRIGFNVDYQATDFASMTQRRTSHEPVEKGGWSLFMTGWTGTDILNPAVNPLLRGAGDAGWFGWLTDQTLEDLRNQWFDSADPAEQQRLATAIQVQAFKSLPYIPLGATVQAVAYNKRVKGVFKAPVQAYWNISKTA